MNGCVGCVKCKKELTEMICEFSRPILKKRQELANDKKYVEDILKEGSLKAEQVASQTMKEIRQAVKL
jgi:tryptophanyl-tRNA synthetase